MARLLSEYSIHFSKNTASTGERKRTSIKEVRS
jgi:hypothetical protein